MYKVIVVKHGELTTEITFHYRVEAFEFAEIVILQEDYIAVYIVNPNGEPLARAHQAEGKGLIYEPN